jgi:hypothetical protein
VAAALAPCDAVVMANFVLVARGGEWDGETIEVDHDPQPGEKVAFPQKDDPMTGPPVEVEYVVTDAVETLPGGEIAHVMTPAG